MEIWDGPPDAPPWIEHDGSEACPVPAGHLVEKRWPGATAFDGTWRTVTHYRDWTAFKELDAMSKENVPVWAIRRAGELRAPCETYHTAFARYIASREEAPSVDPVKQLADDLYREFWGTTRSRTELADYLRARGVTLKEGDA